MDNAVGGTGEGLSGGVGVEGIASTGASQHATGTCVNHREIPTVALDSVC